jgi:hypothetical protein
MEDRDAPQRPATAPVKPRRIAIRLALVAAVPVVVGLRFGAALHHADPPTPPLTEQQLEQVAGRMMSGGTTGQNAQPQDLGATETADGAPIGRWRLS